MILVSENFSKNCSNINQSSNISISFAFFASRFYFCTCCNANHSHGSLQKQPARYSSVLAEKIAFTVFDSMATRWLIEHASTRLIFSNLWLWRRAPIIKLFAELAQTRHQTRESHSTIVCNFDLNIQMTINTTEG